MNFKTDMSRVIGLGSAKAGAEHWFGERVKSVALIPLTIAFLVIIAPLIGADYATVSASLGAPIKAILLCLFFLVSFKHLADGLQVVIEDYVHSKGTFLVLLIGTKMLCWGLGLTAVFAILKIAFEA